MFSYGAAVPAAQKDEVKNSSRDGDSDIERQKQDTAVSSDAVMADADDADGERATNGRPGVKEGASGILDDEYYELTAEDYARLMARKKKPGERTRRRCAVQTGMRRSRQGDALRYVPS